MRRPLTIDRTISVAELAAGSAGLTYLTGYLIHSLFVRNYGMVGSELLRLDYVTSTYRPKDTSRHSSVRCF